MAVQWQPITAIGSLIISVGTLLGLGARQARSRGAHDEQMRELRKAVSDHTLMIANHTAQLAASEGSFRVIDTKLNYISKAIDDMRENK